jgi:hypothetical protein
LKAILEGLLEHYFTARHKRRVKIKDIRQYQHHERKDSVGYTYADSDNWPVLYQQLETTEIVSAGNSDNIGTHQENG